MEQPPTEDETALVERTKRAVRAYMSSQPQFDASHDYAHLQRVLSMAEHILEVVERTLDPPARGYDHTAVRLAALLHDVDDRKYLGPPSSSDDSSQKIEEEETPGGGAKQMLLHLGCSSALASKVQDI
ncbi:MAG: hypothetical protein L6R35_007262, partial [Caloplaca aegaea]